MDLGEIYSVSYCYLNICVGISNGDGIAIDSFVGIVICTFPMNC